MAYPITRSMRLISLVGLIAGGVALDLEPEKQAQGEFGVRAVKLSLKVKTKSFFDLKSLFGPLMLKKQEAQKIEEGHWEADAEAANAFAEKQKVEAERAAAAEKVAAAKIAAAKESIEDALRDPGCDFYMHNYIFSRDGRDGFHEYQYYQDPDQRMHNSRTSVLHRVFPKREDVPLIQFKDDYRKKMIFSFKSKTFDCVKRIEAAVRIHNLFPLDQRTALEDLGKSEVEMKPAFKYLMKRFDDEMEKRTA